MKSDDGSLTFFSMTVLHNTWNYSEKDKDSWARGVGDRTGDKEQRNAKMGENSQSYAFSYGLFSCALCGHCFLPEVYNFMGRISRSVKSQIYLRYY